jgi:hypothetical protein
LACPAVGAGTKPVLKVTWPDGSVSEHLVEPGTVRMEIPFVPPAPPPAPPAAAAAPPAPARARR